MANRLPDAIKRELANKRLVFTVTTGRSGTKYLSTMLSYLPNVQSLHEPLPAFHRVLRAALRDPMVARSFLLEEKLPAIAAYPQSVYIESSHVFCKAFFEPLIDLGIVPDLILLSRSRRDVAISMYQLGHTPSRTHLGRIYHIHPGDPGVLKMPGWETMHDYQLSFWYTLEIERRAKVYGEEVERRGGRVYSVTLDELATVTGYRKLIADMDFPSPRLIDSLRYLKSRLRRVNNRRELKDYSRVEDWDALEAEVLARTGLAQS
jgi:hypothetical protein